HKRQHSFHPPNDNNEPLSLPACSICLSCSSHNVIYCNATHTWDKAHPTFTEHHRTTLYVKNLLCCKWQKDEGCNNKHDAKHICSGHGATSHGAQCCPCAQKLHAHNSL
ncbi:hypothetical protein PAXRUDRAFT_142267, partial [Paxillus rubicundulus Ve08.2h10]